MHGVIYLLYVKLLSNSISCIVGIEFIKVQFTIIRTFLKFTWIHLNKYCPLSFQHSVKYQEYFLKSMLGYVCDTQPEIRQAAAYGVGVMAQFGTELYAATCAGNYPLCRFDISSSENGLSRHAFLKKSNWLRSLL